MKTLIALLFCAIAVNAAANFKFSTNARRASDISFASGIANARSKRDASDGACDLHDSTLTQAEKDQSLDVHNDMRSGEQAADIVKLTWNEDLAKRAQAWADLCVWEHGYTQDCDGNNIGQNMYMAGGGSSFPDVGVPSMLQAWFDEKSDYHYSDRSCNAGKMCGHYTQVVWSKSTEVGCGLAKCPTVNVPGGTPWENALLYVCDYSPSGNWAGTPIYTKGSPCSLCSSSLEEGGFICEDNLCKPCLPSKDANCKCDTLECANGGTYNNDICACQCAAGFFGKSCESECTDVYVDVCPTWEAHCSDAAYHDFMKATCPKTCGMC